LKNVLVFIKSCFGLFNKFIFDFIRRL